MVRRWLSILGSALGYLAIGCGVTLEARPDES